jgi:hypothetical protein
MAAENAQERSPSERRKAGGRAKGGNQRSGSNPEKVERSPKDVTGINPRDMEPIDPRMPYIPPA